MLLPLHLNLGPPGSVAYFSNTPGVGVLGMQKNVAGQKWVVFAFNRTTNVALTGDAANITANLRIDGGAANAIDDVNPTELEDGFYVFDITQAESNGDSIVIAPVSSTANIQVIGTPMALWTTPEGFPDELIPSGSGSVTVNQDTGGANNLSYESSPGVFIDNAVVKAFLKTDFDAGNTTDAFLKAHTTTKVDGDWTTSLMLDPGTYIFQYFKQNFFGPDTKEETIS